VTKDSKSGAAPAIVLACGGAAEGPLNVVRALGAHQVRVILITEAMDSPVVASRHVHEMVYSPNFTQQPHTLIEAVKNIATREGRRPVLFPTADPDLMLVSRWRDALDAVCQVVAPPGELVAQLSDKRRFADLARALELPVPMTCSPSSQDDIAAACRAVRFPVIVKPSHPQAWHPASVMRHVGHAKAIQVDDAAALLSLCSNISQTNFDFLIQEYIPGLDEEHFDVHAFIDETGTPVASFCGQKLRIFPPHAGSGCFVRSVHVEHLITQALEILKAVGYSGIANMNFKRNPITNAYWLLEINPRVSQWNILASRCGINLPWIAYQHACGLALDATGRQTDNIYYLNFSNDFAAFRIYRREGLLSAGQYLRSLLLGPRINQVLDFTDIGPFVSSVRSRIKARLGRH
jgi:predicted ATP-grasp superfamily ATP-dependent carboligase